MPNPSPEGYPLSETKLRFPELDGRLVRLPYSTEVVSQHQVRYLNGRQEKTVTADIRLGHPDVAIYFHSDTDIPFASVLPGKVRQFAKLLLGRKPLSALVDDRIYVVATTNPDLVPVLIDPSARQAGVFFPLAQGDLTDEALQVSGDPNGFDTIRDALIATLESGTHLFFTNCGSLPGRGRLPTPGVIARPE